MNSHFIPTCACISYEMPNWLPGLAYTVPISSELLRGKARGWGMEGGGEAGVLTSFTGLVKLDIF